MPTSYLPYPDSADSTHERLPFGWPQGTGVVISRGTCDGGKVDIATVLARSGCHPKAALRAANYILNEGYYATRLGTSTAMCRNFWKDLRNAGLEMEFESEIPKDNLDHIMHSKNQKREIYSQQPPFDLIQEMIEEELAKENALTEENVFSI